MLVSALLLAVSVLTACGGDETGPTPAPTSESATVSWRSEFTADELEAFDSASGTLTAFESAWQPIIASGAATPAAKKVLQTYRADWQQQFGQLEQFEREEILVPRAATILDVRADRVTLRPSGEHTVSIRRCIDSRNLGATMAGRPLNVPEPPVQVSIATLTRVDGGARWLIYGDKNTGESCNAD